MPHLFFSAEVELLKDFCSKLYLKMGARHLKAMQLNNVLVLDQFAPREPLRMGLEREVMPSVLCYHGGGGTLLTWIFLPASRQLLPAAAVTDESGCLRAPARQRGIELEVMSL